MRLLLALLFLVVLSFSGSGLAQSEPNPEEKPPIIDMHMHARVFTADDKPLPLPCIRTEEPCSNEPSALTSTEALIKATLSAMDEHNIVKGFLSESVDNVYRWVAAASDRFIPSPSLNGGPSSPSIDYLRREYLAGRLEAMGEIGSQYAGMAPNDPILEPYFALAEELDLPVLIHTLGIGARTPNFRSALGHPLLLEEVLVKHPKLRLYVENAGFPFLDEMIALMYQYPQVYADLSTITWIIPRAAFHDYLQRLIRAGLRKRLMFGSDQMSWPETITMAIESIESADFLTEEQKRDIFYNNAVRFLRLEESK